VILERRPRGEGWEFYIAKADLAHTAAIEN
jgi:hypothetical protein